MNRGGKRRNVRARSRVRGKLRLVVAPTLFAVRRMRARPFSFLTRTLALAGAGALIGWSSASAGLAQERSVRLELGALPPGPRSFRVVYYTLPGEGDYRAAPVTQAFAGFSEVTG